MRAEGRRAGRGRTGRRVRVELPARQGEQNTGGRGHLPLLHKSIPKECLLRGRRLGVRARREAGARRLTRAVQPWLERATRSVERATREVWMKGLRRVRVTINGCICRLQGETGKEIKRTCLARRSRNVHRRQTCYNGCCGHYRFAVLWTLPRQPATAMAAAAARAGRRGRARGGPRRRAGAAARPRAARACVAVRASHTGHKQ